MAFRPEVHELAAEMAMDPLPPRDSGPSVWAGQLARNDRWRQGRKRQGARFAYVNLGAEAARTVDAALASGRFETQTQAINQGVLGLAALDDETQAALRELMQGGWSFTDEREAIGMAIRWLAAHVRVNRLTDLSLPSEPDERSLAITMPVSAK